MARLKEERGHFKYSAVCIYTEIQKGVCATLFLKFAIYVGKDRQVTMVTNVINL